MALIKMYLQGVLQDGDGYLPSIQNIVLTQGDNLDIIIANIHFDGSPINIDGPVILTVKQTNTNSISNPIIFAIDGYFQDPSNGIGLFSITTDNTNALKPNFAYSYDLVYTSNENDVAHLIPLSGINVNNSNYENGQPITPPVPQPPTPVGPPVTQMEPALIQLNCFGIVADGYEISQPTIQTLSISFGDNANININVFDSLRHAYDCTGGAILLTVTKSNMGVTTTVLAREAIFTNAMSGDGYVIINTNDTTALSSSAAYSYDVVFIDQFGNQAHIIPISPFIVLPSDYIPGQEITVPSTQQPLAQGPKGDPGGTAYMETSYPLQIDGYTSIPIYIGSGTHTIDLQTSGVSAGSYTNTALTVDAYGRLTSASSGSAGGVTSLTGGGGVTVSSSTGAITLGTSGIPESSITNLTTDLANRALTSTSINTTSPIVGGGDLSADRTISIPQASASVDGFLSQTDWTTFNNKGSGTIAGSISNTQVAFGTGTNTIGGSSNITWNDSAKTLTLPDGYITGNNHLTITTSQPDIDGYEGVVIGSSITQHSHRPVATIRNGSTSADDSWRFTVGGSPTTTGRVLEAIGGSFAIIRGDATTANSMQVSNSSNNDTYMVFDNTELQFGSNGPPVFVESNVADGPTAKVFYISTDNTLADPSASMFEIQNPIGSPAVMRINPAGDIFAKDGYFTKHVSVDGYTINISAGATSGQALIYNGTNFVATSVSSGTVTSVATDTTLTGGPITTTGTIGINLNHANTWLQKQTFSSHISIDGYTVDLSAGASSGQALIYNGSNFVATSGGTGTVTSVATTSRLTGGPITTAGTLDLATSGVSAASYTYTSLTVDAYGRITAASNGTNPSGTFLPLAGGTMTGSILASPDNSVDIGATGATRFRSLYAGTAFLGPRHDTDGAGALVLGDVNATSIGIGNASSTTAMNGVVNTDITFIKENNRVISVAASTTNAAAGGNLSVMSGNGSPGTSSIAGGLAGSAAIQGGIGGTGVNGSGVGGQGGNVNTFGGVGGAAGGLGFINAGGLGGGVAQTGGTGGAAGLGSGAGGAGGAGNTSGGVGGAGTLTGAAGAGGAAGIIGGNAGSNTTGAGSAAGGAASVSGGNGSVGDSSHAPGAGGTVNIAPGTTGTAVNGGVGGTTGGQITGTGANGNAAATTATAGAGGRVFWAGGAGGAGSANVAGASGGAVTTQGGVGGTGVNAGGVGGTGGAIASTGGVGGAAGGSGSTLGGNGGGASIFAGAGGAAGAGTGAGGAGGVGSFAAGAGGASSSTAAAGAGGAANFNAGNAGSNAAGGGPAIGGAATIASGNGSAGDGYRAPTAGGTMLMTVGTTGAAIAGGIGGTTGGAIQITGAAGNAANTTATAGVGGSVTITTGAGGAGSANVAGVNAGTLALNGASGGSGVNGGGAGGIGGQVNGTAGTGGAAGGSTFNTLGGNGGGMAFAAGAGGAAGAGTGAGGAGGAGNFKSGAGGASSATGGAGAGGVVTLGGGNGGSNALGGGSAAGGAVQISGGVGSNGDTIVGHGPAIGGAIALNPGATGTQVADGYAAVNGAAITGTSANGSIAFVTSPAGVGGAVTWTTGNGGAGSANVAGGNAGTMSINGGTGGTGVNAGGAGGIGGQVNGTGGTGGAAGGSGSTLGGNGGGMTFAAGNGGAAGAGTGAGGAGGIALWKGGTGGAATSTGPSGAGGQANVTAGNAGSNASGGGSAVGGSITLTGGNGSNGSTGGAPSAGGAITLTPGTSGTTFDGYTGAIGAGITGTAATGTAAGGSTGTGTAAAGGVITWTGGNGGAAAALAAGATGGKASFIAGNGGAASSAQNAGNGGAIAITAGNAGSAASGTTHVGTGGAVAILGGNGSASGTATSNGGAVTIDGGAKGGTTGSSGTISIGVTNVGTISMGGAAGLMGMFGATAVVQPQTTGTTIGFTAGGGTTVTDASTFTGNSGSTAYRISDIVLALKQLGLLKV